MAFFWKLSKTGRWRPTLEYARSWVQKRFFLWLQWVKVKSYRTLYPHLSSLHHQKLLILLWNHTSVLGELRSSWNSQPRSQIFESSRGSSDRSWISLKSGLCSENFILGTLNESWSVLMLFSRCPNRKSKTVFLSIRTKNWTWGAN